MSRLTEASLSRSLTELARSDAHFADAIARFGLPALRRREPGFATLLRAIVGQQVSVAAASAIWGRLEASVETVTAESINRQSENDLRAVGLSRQKIAYARGLADDVIDGRVVLDRLPEMDDETAIAELVKVKGIGRWSAEVYLLFALGRPDIFPADDIALMTAAQRMRGLDERPKAKALRDIAEDWRPWRGAAAHMLWHYYHHTVMTSSAAPV